jgi:outer membrane protein
VKFAIPALFAVVAVTAAFAVPTHAEEPARVGYMDLRKVLLESKAGKHNKAELEKLIKQKQEKLKQEEQKLKNLQQAYEKEQLLLTEQQKKDKQKEFQEKVQAFQKLQGEAEQEIRRKDGEYSQKAIEAIRRIVADVAKEKKLMLVFEQTAQPLYAEPGPDLTAEVLKRYDAKHK